MLGAIKDRMVADWGTMTKFWSVRMNAIGAVLYPLLISVQAMPAPIQELFPVQYRAIAAGVFAIASLAVRFIIQPKLSA
jgi:hypothetical protein